MVIALTFMFASGLLLAAADIEAFAASPIFWTKLTLVALLLTNGIVMTRTEASLDRAMTLGHEPAARFWKRLRRSAWMSLALWTATTLAGAALASG